MLSNVDLANVLSELASAMHDARQDRRYWCDNIDPIEDAVQRGSERTLSELADALRAMTALKTDDNQIAEMLRDRARRTTRAAAYDDNSLTRAARKVVAEVLEELAADLSPTQPEGSSW